MTTRILTIIFSLLLFACASPEERTTEKAAPLENTDQAIKEEVFYPSGVLKMRGETINGKKHGSWTAWFENGGIWSKSEFDHGVSNGSSTVFHGNGLTFYTGTYTNGEKTGEWSYYDEQGELVKKVNYDEQQ